MKKNALLIMLALAPFILSACDSDLPPPPRHPEDRAVSSNLSVSDPDHEYLAPAPDAVPLVKVDLPNNENEKPKVTTIVDVVRTTLNPPAAAPAIPPPPPSVAGPPVLIQHGSPDTSAPPPGTQP